MLSVAVKRRVMKRRRATLAAIRRRHRKKLKDAGLMHVDFWITPRTYELVKEQARHLGIPRSIVLRAAIEEGVRLITPSRISMVERAYRQVCHYPLAPHYPGAKFDPSLVVPLSRANEARKRYQAEVAS